MDRAAKEQMREDANALLRASVGYGRRMLRKYGEFAPFAFSLDSARTLVNETVARTDMPAEPGLLLDLLHRQLAERAAKREIVAAAAVVNVSLGKASEEGFPDALLVEIEHQDGYCVKAFVPYRMAGGQLFNLLPRVARFGKVLTQDGEARFFAR